MVGDTYKKKNDKKFEFPQKRFAHTASSISRKLGISKDYWGDSLFETEVRKKRPSFLHKLVLLLNNIRKKTWFGQSGGRIKGDEVFCWTFI